MDMNKCYSFEKESLTLNSLNHLAIVKFISINFKSILEQNNGLQTFVKNVKFIRHF